MPVYPLGRPMQWLFATTWASFRWQSHVSGGRDQVFLPFEEVTAFLLARDRRLRM
ncbi:hypothetical protein GCM10022419_028020 [Nonomuraea rosea]|uniref:Uncharacterized protein n=1 Tax=Nonomuraea rosea TaxID=638574 RepID=A0ABP6W6L9_9ACTN